jgi:hypothetical protein
LKSTYKSFHYSCFLKSFHIPVIESIPNNIHTAHINVSNIVGACMPVIEQYIITNTITRNPRTPHTLLEDIPECEVTIYLTNFVILFII